MILYTWILFFNGPIALAISIPLDQLNTDFIHSNREFIHHYYNQFLALMNLYDCRRYYDAKSVTFDLCIICKQKMHIGKMNEIEKIIFIQYY